MKRTLFVAGIAILAWLSLGAILKHTYPSLTDLPRQVLSVLEIANTESNNLSVLSVEPAAKYLTVGEQASLSVRAWDESGTELKRVEPSFQSKKPKVAAISPDGTISGVAPGKAKILTGVGGLRLLTPVRVFESKDALAKATDRYYQLNLPIYTNGKIKIFAYPAPDQDFWTASLCTEPTNEVPPLGRIAVNLKNISRTPIEVSPSFIAFVDYEGNTNPSKRSEYLRALESDFDKHTYKLHDHYFPKVRVMPRNGASGELATRIGSVSNRGQDVPLDERTWVLCSPRELIYDDGISPVIRISMWHWKVLENTVTTERPDDWPIPGPAFENQQMPTWNELEAEKEAERLQK